MHNAVPIHKDIFAAKNVMNFFFIFRVTTQDSATTLSLPQYWKNFEKFSMNAAFLQLSSSSCSHPQHAGFPSQLFVSTQHSIFPIQIPL
jgi:hypothetical protein